MLDVVLSNGFIFVLRLQPFTTLDNADRNDGAYFDSRACVIDAE